MSDVETTTSVGGDPPVKHTTAEVAVATASGLRWLDGDVELAGRDVTAVAAGRSGPIALVDGREVHIREAGGDWRFAARLDDGVARCLVAHGDQVFVGGTEARLWRLVGDRLERVTTFDRAPTHDEWHTPWGGPPDLYSFASDGTHLYVGVHVGGILRTTDGRSWTATIDLHDDVHQVVVDGDGVLWAATGMQALARSADLGDTWEYFGDGLHGRYALAVATGTAGTLVSVSSGPFADDGRIYRLSGDRLEPVEGLPAALDGAVGPGRLAAAGPHAAVALPNDAVHISADGGASWSLGAAGADEVRGVAFVTRA